MEQRKIKVLVLGIGQSNFLNALYGEILKRDNCFDFKIDSLKHLPNDSYNEIATIFSEILNFDAYIDALSRHKKRWIFFKEVTKSFFLRAILLELSEQKSIKRALRICKELAVKKYVYRHYIAPQKYDVLHFHFCIRSNLEYVHFIGKETKVICSYWGSDLWRASNTRNNYYVNTALNNATVITMQTPEMGQALKAKHGIHLDHKMRYLRFTMNTATCDAINLYRNDQVALEAFRRKYDFPNDKIIVALGHNAFQENNHLAMIKAVNLLPKEITDKMVFALHISYGRKDAYIKVLKKEVKNSQNAVFRIIDEFMAPDVVAKLRLVTDIMIHAPISDALSGTVIEVLYAGNKVMLPGWLSFGLLRRNDISYNEFNDFEDLPEKLMQLYKQLPIDQQVAATNKLNIEKLLFPDRTSADWIKLFKEVVHG